MEIIKMESNIKNYIYRILENYKNNLQYSNLTPTRIKYEREQLNIAMSRLQGKEPKISLDKNIGGTENE